MPSRFITEPEDMDNASFLLTLIRISGASKDRPIIDRCYLSKKLEAFSRSDLHFLPLANFSEESLAVDCHKFKTNHYY